MSRILDTAGRPMTTAELHAKAERWWREHPLEVDPSSLVSAIVLNYCAHESCRHPKVSGDPFCDRHQVRRGARRRRSR